MRNITKRKTRRMTNDERKECKSGEGKNDKGEHDEEERRDEALKEKENKAT